MQHPLPDLGEWPPLEWEQWKDTAETLHMYMQIVGKVRLALTPIQNHWWNIAFYLTARGLMTSAMPAEGMSLDIEFDLLSHEVVCRTSRGEIRKIPLRPLAVAMFFEEFTKTLAFLGVHPKIDPMPVEVANPIRFDVDTVHFSYDSEAVTRFFHALRIADTLLKRFSTNFYGKISPVHFFWGSFDLAVTRFNGRRAPARPGALDSVQAEAYSHEVISAGFWPGNGGYGSSAFYAYAAPTPDGLQNTVLKGKGGFNQKMGEFILDYADARDSADPADTVLEFLQDTYSAAADLAKWDRAMLDRQDEVAGAMRLRYPHVAQKPPR